MARFFIMGTNIADGAVRLTGANAAHAKVLRLRAGDRIIVCDGDRTDHHCTIRRISPEEVEAEVLESVPSPAEPRLHCTILAGLPKQGERSDYIVQKCTECGAAEIVFFRSHRCVATPDAQGMEKKLLRWQRIAEEAAKQSGHGVIPSVRAVPDFVSVLDAAAKTELPLFLYETGAHTPLRDVLEPRASSVHSAAILTGPEGGFEAYEADMAAKIGFPLCSIGPRILRCEAAPVAALTALLYAAGEL